MGIEILPDLRVSIGSFQLKNPVMTASGTFGYGEEFASLVDLHRLGAVIVKGISHEPRAGNMPPRIVETSCGMLNAIGLENVGFEGFVKEKLPYLRNKKVPVIVNILGDSIEEYCILAEKLNDIEGVSALEINISCPNVKKGGVAFGTDPDMAEAVTSGVRKRCTLPVIVKLSPNVTDITVIAKAVVSGGCDAISLVNTLLGMAIDIHTRKPKLANIVGGLSGPAIKPVALRMVWQVAQAVKVPVIGIGGITTAADAIEFMIAGATAIQVGTANFINPGVSEEILDGIATYLNEKGLTSVQELIGSLEI
ncbi:MAG: dihydroorotate dehydrogenase [Proteobacteria bacterium]|nr:dihydroorotate dehydrogenase [Pseudomonadota bacterium]MBU1708576.1 dihydroorotate dehydrogenase [Pseudomonadota bacterium]